jgi:hypothetical protein
MVVPAAKRSATSAGSDSVREIAGSHKALTPARHLTSETGLTRGRPHLLFMEWEGFRHAGQSIEARSSSE